MFCSLFALISVRAFPIIEFCFWEEACSSPLGGHVDTAQPCKLLPNLIFSTQVILIFTRYVVSGEMNSSWSKETLLENPGSSIRDTPVHID